MGRFLELDLTLEIQFQLYYCSLINIGLSSMLERFAFLVTWWKQNLCSQIHIYWHLWDLVFKLCSCIWILYYEIYLYSFDHFHEIYTFKWTKATLISVVLFGIHCWKLLFLCTRAFKDIALNIGSSCQRYGLSFDIVFFYIIMLRIVPLVRFSGFRFSLTYWQSSIIEMEPLLQTVWHAYTISCSPTVTWATLLFHIGYLPTCVGFRYRYTLVKRRSSFSWECLGKLVSISHEWRLSSWKTWSKLQSIEGMRRAIHLWRPQLTIIFVFTHILVFVARRRSHFLVEDDIIWDFTSLWWRYLE
jgi:hypothetical protein